MAESKAPLLINSCEVDQMFPIEAQEKTDALLGNGQYTPGYLRTYWEGCTHGFAVRGDLVSFKFPLSGLTLTASFYFRATPRFLLVRKALSRRPVAGSKSTCWASSREIRNAITQTVYIS